ncbi:MAG TPA: hypothetical protein VFE96_04080, partial [Candidatus Bathyarchaeia archaeon]|nr:hypothetical protein [Candidatus Bathyarchaeia archaeon]
MTLLTWKKIGKPTPLTLTLGTALLLRLIVIPLLYDDYNYWAFGVFTNLLLTGNNPYHIVTNDPTLLNINPWRYPPLFLTFTAPALIAKTITGSTLAYLATLKIPLAMADLVSAFYVYKILLFRFPERTALKFTVLYAFNPLVIFESAGGGFNDPIPIALTVVSLYYFVSYRERKDSSHNHELGTSAFLLGLGIAAKIYPLLLLPVFLREIRGTMSRLGYAVVTILPMALVSTPFMISDSTSYIGLLIVRSVGGLHPLIPFASLGGAIGPLAIASLVVLLLWTYVTTVELLTRITLVFLWVNIAIFAQSLNYMMWGIPFFTILAAENHKMWGSTLSAGVTFVTALIFQGWYNGSTGETGLFYWSDHLLHQQVVVFRLYPFSTIDPVILVTTLLLLSVAVNAIYFILCRLPNTSGFRDANTRESERSASPKVFSKKQFSLFGSICLLILLSWSATGLFANFEPHEYPVVKGSYFQFEDHFHTSILGYQWAFRGGGNYSVNPSQGYLDISDS